MSAILKNEEFIAIEQAVNARTAPAEIAAAFNELFTLRGELKNLASLKITTSKP